MAVPDLIVVPACDEAATLGEVLARTRAAAPHATVLVVDDGSRDATGCLALAAGARLVSHPRPLGYGRALLSGLEWGRSRGFDRLVTLDADLQHEPESVGQFLRALERSDIAAGSRYHPRSSAVGRTPILRRGINREVTRRLNRLTGLRRTDAFCGFNGFALRALQPLRLDQPGYLFTLQLWVQAARHGLRIEEVPVRRIYREERSFGPELDDPRVRRKMYLDFLAAEIRR